MKQLKRHIMTKDRRRALEDERDLALPKAGALVEKIDKLKVELFKINLRLDEIYEQLNE